MPIDLSKLRAPFSPERISWRVGPTNADKTKGQALCYIDARDVMQRLDEVCGPENWECRYPHAGAKTVCEIGIFINERWVVKADGAGDSDVEAEKGALSDAFKRAAVKWGVGQYLYDLDSPWVAIEPMGRSYKIAAGEYAKLRAILSKGTTPSQAPAKARVTYSDEDGQLAAWIARQKELIAACKTLPATYEWLSKVAGRGAISDPDTGSQLHKLKEKAPEQYGELAQAFQKQLVEINRSKAA